MIEILSKQKLPILGFLGICLFGVGAWLLKGTIYREAAILDLFSSLQSSGLYLGSAIATSSGTTLALMLTLVGLVRRMDKDFDRQMYQTVALISVTSAVCLVASIVLLLTLTLPVSEFDGVPNNYFLILYNTAFSLTVLVSALSVSIVLMLVGVVVSVIRKITPSEST